MVGYEVQNTLTENGHVARGVCSVGTDETPQDIVERTKIMRREEGIAFTEDDGTTWTPLSEGTVVSMNFWGFTRSFVSEMEARFPAFLDKALAENPLKVNTSCRV